jgi:hypothetical protein
MPHELILRPKKSMMLPDEGFYINRFYVKSESSDRLYKVSQHKTGRWWACGCRGWIGHKHCKHLEELGLPCYNKPFEAKLEGSK